MKTNSALQVLYDGRLVGTLAMTANHKAAFQYGEEWLEHGFSISPFSLPLKNQVFVPNKDYFDGLFGVFTDSLPDNWGSLLLNRLLRANGQNPYKLTVLDRLSEHCSLLQRLKSKNPLKSFRADPCIFQPAFWCIVLLLS